MIRYLKTLAIMLIGLVGWIFWCVVIFSVMINNNPIIIIDFSNTKEFMLQLFLTIVLSEVLIVLLIDYILNTRKNIQRDI